MALVGVNRCEEMTTSIGLARIGASICPQGNNGSSWPSDCPQSSTYDVAKVMGQFSVVDEGPSRVLCTLEEEDGSLSEDEVLLDDGLDGSKLQLVCKEFGCKSEVLSDEPSPICSLPPVPLELVYSQTGFFRR